jgi:hypothetical protein
MLKRTRRVNLLKLVTIAAVLSFTSAAAVEQTSARPGSAGLDLRCLPLEQLACGCSLKIVTLSCGASHSAGWKAHFASELNDGAPLRLNLGDRIVSLRSRRPITNSFSYAKGDRWTEEYEGEGLKVVIRYRPGKSTCPAVKPGQDDCEYFDVAADVVITRAEHERRTYKAIGSCGC